MHPLGRPVKTGTGFEGDTLRTPLQRRNLQDAAGVVDRHRQIGLLQLDILLVEGFQLGQDKAPLQGQLGVEELALVDAQLARLDLQIAVDGQGFR